VVVVWGLAGAIPTKQKVIVAAFLDAHNKLVSQVQMLQSKELPPAVPVKGQKP
jgi:hypothetical protein